MQSLLTIVHKWKAIAQRKQKKAIQEDEAYESNYQLGKIVICNEFIAQLKKDIEESKEKETSKEGNKESLQNVREDHQA